MTLGVSLATVLWSTWPRTVAQTPRAQAAFLTHESAWIDSVILSGTEAALLRQRIALYVPEEGGHHAPEHIAALVNRHQVGSVWFENQSRKALSRHIHVIRKQPGLTPFMGLLPAASVSDVPAVPAGLGLAGLSSVAGLAGLSESLALESRQLGIQALGIPAMQEAYDLRQAKPMQYPASLLCRQLADLRIHPVLSGAADLEALLEADSLERMELLQPLIPWTRVPVSAWIVHEPSHDVQVVEIADLLNFLRRRLGFDGLVIVKLRDHATPQGARSAMGKLLQSGVDQIMVRPDQLELLAQQYDRLFQSRSIRLANHKSVVKKILQAKSWNMPVIADSVGAVASPALLWQLQSLLEQQASLFQREDAPVPVTNLMDRTVHVVGMGLRPQPFVTMLRRYFPVSVSNGMLQAPWFALSSVRLAKYDPLILVFGPDIPAKDGGLMWQQIRNLGDQVPLVIVNLGTPVNMAHAPANVSILQGYDAGQTGQEVAAQMIAGGLGIQGQFPLLLNERLATGSEGMTTPIRLSYGLPEAVGLDSRLIARIDSIAWEGISELAMPGAQVLVAQHGRVIYDRSIGYHTYLKRRGVYPTDLYDIASMTKIVGTTLAAMSMKDQGNIQIEEPIRTYLDQSWFWQDSAMITDTLYFGLSQVQAPVLDSLQEPVVIPEGKVETDTTFLPGDSILVTRYIASGKVRQPSRALEATLFDLMTHTSGLPAGLNLGSFFQGGSAWRLNRDYFSARPDSLHNIPVARDLYLRNDMADSIWHQMLALPRQASAGYRYSDVNMILVQRVIDSINEASIDQYLNRNWYKPLGLQHTTFRPTESFERDRLVPTEYDRRYRNQTLQGYVHDPSAAFMGGVAGNAGLFSTSNDLAIIAQVWLQEGNYGGRQWVDAATVREFTRVQKGHRGLGFDKPPKEGNYVIAPSAGPRSFGHTGFTGTMMWVDPDEELVFIFLSNRVHPRANNWLINQLNIRQRMHEVVYEAIREARAGGDGPGSLIAGQKPGAGGDGK